MAPARSCNRILNRLTGRPSHIGCPFTISCCRNRSIFSYPCTLSMPNGELARFSSWGFCAGAIDSCLLLEIIDIKGYLVLDFRQPDVKCYGSVGATAPSNGSRISALVAIATSLRDDCLDGERRFEGAYRFPKLAAIVKVEVIVFEKAQPLANQKCPQLGPRRHLGKNAAKSRTGHGPKTWPHSISYAPSRQAKPQRLPRQNPQPMTVEPDSKPALNSDHCASSG